MDVQKTVKSKQDVILLLWNKFFSERRELCLIVGVGRACALIETLTKGYIPSILTFDLFMPNGIPFNPLWYLGARAPDLQGSLRTSPPPSTPPPFARIVCGLENTAMSTKITQSSFSPWNSKATLSRDGHFHNYANFCSFLSHSVLKNTDWKSGYFFS